MLCDKIGLIYNMEKFLSKHDLNMQLLTVLHKLRIMTIMRNK